MSEKEKTAAKKIAEAMNILPENKRGYIIGYAEGVIAASGERRDGVDMAADAGKTGE